MKTNRFILTAFLASTMLISCNKTQDATVTPTVQLSQTATDAIEKVSNAVIDNLDYDYKYALARLSSQDWSTRATVLKMGTEASNSYWSTRTIDLNGMSFFTTNVANVTNVKNDINSKINSGLSSADLLAALKQIDSNLNNYGLDADGMKDAKLLVVTLEKFVAYWQANVEPKAKGARIDGVQASPGLKCAAGIISGFLIGGLGGVGAGATVGAAGGPVGIIVGGTVGGLLGEIGGALGGYAASC